MPSKYEKSKKKLKYVGKKKIDIPSYKYKGRKNLNLLFKRFLTDFPDSGHYS